MHHTAEQKNTKFVSFPAASLDMQTADKLAVEELDVPPDGDLVTAAVAAAVSPGGRQEDDTLVLPAKRLIKAATTDVDGQVRVALSVGGVLCLLYACSRYDTLLKVHADYLYVHCLVLNAATLHFPANVIGRWLINGRESCTSHWMIKNACSSKLHVSALNPVCWHDVRGISSQCLLHLLHLLW